MDTIVKYMNGVVSHFKSILYMCIDMCNIIGSLLKSLIHDQSINYMITKKKKKTAKTVAIILIFSE